MVPRPAGQRAALSVRSRASHTGASCNLACNMFPAQWMAIVSELSALKNEGNELYKAKDWAGAAASYSKAIALAPGLEPDSDGEDASENGQSLVDELPNELRQVCAVVYTNRSAAFYAQKKYVASLSDAKDAALFDPTFWKVCAKPGGGRGSAAMPCIRPAHDLARTSPRPPYRSFSAQIQIHRHTDTRCRRCSQVYWRAGVALLRMEARVERSEQMIRAFDAALAAPTLPVAQREKMQKYAENARHRLATGKDKYTAAECVVC